MYDNICSLYGADIFDKSYKEALNLFYPKGIPERFSDPKVIEPVLIPEIYAEFPGGYDSLYKFINSHLNYKNACGMVSGRVFIQFTIERTGEIKNTRIIKGVSETCDAEVLRVFSQIGNWIPAKIDSSEVASIITIPVMIKPN